MPHTVSIEKVLDGPRTLIFQVYLKHDGASADLADVEIAKPADFGMAAKPGFRVDEIWYDVSGFLVRLEFNDLADNPIWVCSSSANQICFEEVGGLADRSGLDGNGALQLSTVGFAAGMEASILIKVRKK
jgi:hypothetical protein